MYTCILTLKEPKWKAYFCCELRHFRLSISFLTYIILQMNNQHMAVSSDHPSVSSTPCSHLMYFLGGMGNLHFAHLDPMEFSGKNGDERRYRCCYLFGSLLKLLWLRSWHEILWQSNLLDCFVDILGRRSCWVGQLVKHLLCPSSRS